MSSDSPLMQITVGGTPGLTVQQKGNDPKHRWRAQLKGRSCGGYLIGSGPTPEAAIDDLEADVQRYLRSVRDGRKAWLEAKESR